MRIPALLITLFAFLLTAQASDLAKEQRWADQIADAIFDGEILQLNDGNTDFLAIFTPAEAGNSRDAVILLHGLGVHPDWDQVIRPLRTGLPQKGWSTLSLQMPILANGVPVEEYAPLFDEAPPRIAAGLDYLRTNGIKRVVVVAHSLGASMGSYSLAQQTDPLLHGFVSIGMDRSTRHPQMDSVSSLSAISIPTLDIYGEHDNRGVLDSAEARRQAILAHYNPLSAQRQVAGANHFFDGMDAELVEVVGNWLATLPR
jgi:pimeloyl-ACP methyl ester carboxylesterase